MNKDLFMPFRLVGGTALSLQTGHRMSDDIDMFSGEIYGSIDFNEIKEFIKINIHFMKQAP